jgi:hypothetical protein
MSKGVAALHKEIRKKEHRASKLGQLEKKLWAFYDDRRNKQFFENEDGEVQNMNPNIRWVDIHRATTRSRQTDLEDAFKEEFRALQEKYATLTDDLLTEQMQKELDYLTALQHGPTHTG